MHFSFFLHQSLKSNLAIIWSSRLADQSGSCFIIHGNMSSETKWKVRVCYKHGKRHNGARWGSYWLLEAFEISTPPPFFFLLCWLPQSFHHKPNSQGGYLLLKLQGLSTTFRVRSVCTNHQV